jgi:hypothetical protein
MYALGFSLDNLSLLALTLAVGFVVDDAIVMLENIVRHVEAGEKPFDAAIRGAREIGFTIISMTLSLVAVFIPVMFMGGIIGRLLHEFAVTISAAILVRGDNAFGNERVMLDLEEIGQRYLFKLRQTAGVKRLIERQWQEGEWVSVGQGFDAVESTLKLAGWSHARRVVVLRRRVKGSLAVETNDESPQHTLHFIDGAEKAKLWEYAVLVTNADYPLEAMGPLYRDRADCENGFDELKNQWGWGGYTTHDIERCNLSARAVALIYNWWSWYVRLAHPKTRLEAITSRPLLLSGVARLTEHAGQSRLLLTLTHAAGDRIKSMIANIRAGLDHVRASAPQLPKADRWRDLLRYIIEKIIATKPKIHAPPIFAPPQIALEGG